MQLEIGNTTLNVELDEVPLGENLGNSYWTFSYREVRRVCKRMPLLVESSICEDLDEQLDDCEASHMPEELAEATLNLWNVDCGIAVLACMLQLGGEWYIGWSGDSEYWFFHDLIHAQHDHVPDNRGDVNVDIDSEDEEFAMIEGAKLAQKHGVSIGNIARQIADAERDWENRFGYESYNLLEQCFD